MKILAFKTLPLKILPVCFLLLNNCEKFKKSPGENAAVKNMTVNNETAEAVGTLAPVVIATAAPLAQKTLAFSWTNSSRVLGSSSQNGSEVAWNWINSTLDQAQATNPTLEGLGGQIETGYGLYTAADPVNSSSYGRIMVEVAMPQGFSRLAISKGGRLETLPVVKSNAPAILYNYGGTRFSGGGRAIVFRAPEALVREDVFVYDCRNNEKTFAKHEVLEKTDLTNYRKVLTVWCDHMSFFRRAGENSQFLKNSDGTPSDFAATVAAFSELSNIGTKVRALTDSLLKDDALKAKMPICARTLALMLNPSSNSLEYKWSQCIEAMQHQIEAQIAFPTAEKPTRLIGDDELTVAEVAAILQHLGYLETGSYTDKKVMAQKFLAKWKAQPNASARLSEAVDGLLALKEKFTKEGFNAWSVPQLQSDR